MGSPLQWLKWLWRELTDAQKYKSLQKGIMMPRRLCVSTFWKHLFIVSSRRLEGYVVVFTGGLTNLVTFIKTENVAVVK
jgi:hypothetical protein